MHNKSGSGLEFLRSWEETIYYTLDNPKFNTEAIVAERTSFERLCLCADRVALPATPRWPLAKQS